MELAEQVVVGLPRSNLIKSKSSDVAPAFAPVQPSPRPVASPFEAASTLAGVPAPYSFAPFVAPVAVVAIGDTTLPDGIEAVPVSRAPYPSAISTNELLERAAALGPARMTWESIVLPADPILDEKRQPHVAERRERFTRMVKIGLGACVAVCVVALGVSAVSGDASASTSTSATVSAALGRTVPATRVVTVEALDGTKHAKAVRRTTPATAAIVRAKRR